MRFFRSPSFITQYFSGLEWRVSKPSEGIYLTFDDGPIPGLTEYVLDCLKDFEARATFFCVGDNIRKHPSLFKRVLQEGHQVGNHTYHHLDAWKTKSEPYLEDVAACQELLQEPKGGIQTKPLFRPPYGKLKPRQYKALSKEYRVIMWDLLTYDFDQSLAPEDCLVKALRYTRAGSIVVFHDNWKAERNLRYVLPRYLAHFQRLGYKFHCL